MALNDTPGVLGPQQVHSQPGTPACTVTGQGPEACIPPNTTPLPSFLRPRGETSLRVTRLVRARRPELPPTSSHPHKDA